jgi:transposase
VAGGGLAPMTCVRSELNALVSRAAEAAAPPTGIGLGSIEAGNAARMKLRIIDRAALLLHRLLAKGRICLQQPIVVLALGQFPLRGPAWREIAWVRCGPLVTTMGPRSLRTSGGSDSHDHHERNSKSR